ncbi:hypothetical protein [Nostoc piscinale]|uniref:hypothetical protein n=1 Tax=Nostoc piscinale TaxID=224012 RepID=UPI001F42EE75|nr:hypothetical protein [Nostoc piscinale]
MTQISARKRDLTLLSICSAFPILPVATAAAQTPPQTQQKVESPNVPELIAPVEDDLEAVFSPPRPSQPDKLVTSDQIESFSSIENTEDNQANISSDQINTFTAGEKAETKQTPETAATSIDSDIRIITPVAGVTTAKTTNLGVQYHPNNQVTVTLNGKPIDAAISQYLHKDEAQKLNTLIWYNVPLNKGENTITAQGADGKSTSVKVTVEEVQKKNCDRTYPRTQNTSRWTFSHHIRR